LRIPLSLRNLTRHRRRTATALAAISFSVASVVLSGGFFDWLLKHLRESSIESRLGHLQVTQQGYKESGIADPFAHLLPNKSPEFTTVNSLPEAKVVASRISFSGIISHGETSVSFLGEGVEPDKETILSKQVAIVEGENLSPDDANGILLGAGLAANLGVKPGDSIVLLANASSGSINGVEGHVRGLFATFTKAYDDSALRVPLPMAQRLLRTTGVHSWVMLLHQTGQTEAALATLKSQLGESKLQITPWYELADFYNKLSALLIRQVNVIRGIIALVVLLSISNTLIMSVMERTGEIGTLMAMGSNRREILGLFVSEGGFLGLLGSIIGVLLSLILASIISAIGIPMPPPPGSDRGFTAGILLSWETVLIAMTLVTATTLIASLYPAWKASRLEIVDALRHNK